MKRKHVFLAALVFISFSYGNTRKINKLTDDVLPNVLKLALSINDETITDSEYLLAKPQGVAVSREGDIMVLDEDRVKVFTANGKVKEIVGGPGDGPGEFRSVSHIDIRDNGYMSVYNRNRLWHIFNPDRSFKEVIKITQNQAVKEVMEKKNLRPRVIDHVFALGENERLSVRNGQYKDMNVNKSELFIFYETGNNIVEIANYPETKYIGERGVGYLTILEIFGTIYLDILPGNRIVYLHSYHDRKISGSDGQYTLQVYSLKDQSRKLLVHSYSPTPFTYNPYRRDAKGNAEYKRLQDLTKETIDAMGSQPAIQKLIADGNTIFAFTYLKNDKDEVLADIFDGERLEYLRSAYFSKVPNTIKNGYAYCLKTGKDILPELEKYKIDDAVYKR